MHLILFHRRHHVPVELADQAVLAQLAVHSAANRARSPLKPPGGPQGALQAVLDAEVDSLVALAARTLPGASYGRFLALAYTFPAPDTAQVREALCWELEQLRQRVLAENVRRTPMRGFEARGPRPPSSGRMAG